MANTWINHPNGSTGNGGGYTDNYAGTWSQWHDGTFGAVDATLYATIAEGGDGKVRVVAAGAFENTQPGILAMFVPLNTLAEGRYEVLAVDAGGGWVEIDLAWNEDVEDDDVASWALGVGGALDSVDDARALLANDGDRQLICTNTTTQSVYAQDGTMTWPDLAIDVMGVDEADGSRLAFNRFKTATTAGNILPKITYTTTATGARYEFGNYNRVSGISFVAFSNFGGCVNNGSTKYTLFSGISAENDSAHASSYVARAHYGTIYNARLMGKVTTQRGNFVNAIIIGNRDLSGDILLEMQFGNGYWNTVQNLVVINAAATKENIIGVSVGISTSANNSAAGLTIINCATGIDIASGNYTGVGIVGNNLIYNCTNAYGISGNFTALANRFLFDRNAYNGTRNLPAGAWDAGTDLVLTSDPFVNSAAGDYRLNPDGAQFASLYDDDTGTFIGALGPELPEGGGGGWRPRPRLIGV